MRSSNPLKLSAMHHHQLETGAVMVESDGWLLPARYSSVERELEQVRDAVGLCDISPGAKLSLQGTELDPWLGRLLAHSTAPEIGAVASIRLDTHEVLLARLASDELMMFAGPDQLPALVNGLSDQAGECVHVVDLTSALAGVSIAGPSGHLLLSGVTDLEVSPDAFPDMSCAQTMVAEIHALLLRRDLGDLLGYELYFGREFGEYMWDALLEAGEAYQVTPFGIETLARFDQTAG